MSILDRLSDLFQARTNRLLNILEDPNDLMDLSYEKMLLGIQETKRHLADVVAQQMSLARQIEAVDRESAQAQDDARLAVKAGRDDLARAALVHRQQAQDRRATLQAALDSIAPQAAKLADYEKQLEQRVEAFRTRKDTMKASYTAAQAQVKASEALTGLGSRFGDAAGSVRRAEERTAAVQDKAAALEALAGQGVLADPLDGRSRFQIELQALRDGHAVEDELAALKADLGVASLPPTPAAPPALPAPGDPVR